VSDLAEHAVDLAERGYAVFPCWPRTKRPLTTHGFTDATRDERAIRHMWDRKPDANIAAACGASAINVLDIESKAGADYREVVADFNLEEHPAVLTGEAPERSQQHPDSLSGNRGAQVFFRGVHRTAQTTIKGVELRGVGAYVVLPPSIHPSGVQYRGELPPVEGLGEMPASVLKILPAPATDGGRTAAGVWLSMLRDGVTPGTRNQQLTRIVGHLLRRYIDVDLAAELLHLINNQCCQPPLAADEVDRIFDSICAKELRRRRGQT
jgi:hypothetical protein